MFSPLKIRPTRAVSRGLLVSAALAVVLAGCATNRPLLDSLSTGSIGASAVPADPQAAVKYWGDRYQANGKNRDVAINYATALRENGSPDQAVAVLQKAVINFPDDSSVLAAYGKALAADGQLAQALDAVQRAQTPDKPDWNLMSTEAAIDDQMGDPDSARKLHAQAVKGAPNDPSILSNYAMSYVLTGDLKQAETMLRQAVAMPNADGRVRQNLALVVGLQGRFTEAQQIASADLPPDQAAANVAYLKQMLAQQNTWQTLQNGGVPASGTTVPPAKPAAGKAT